MRGSQVTVVGTRLSVPCGLRAQAAGAREDDEEDVQDVLLVLTDPVARRQADDVGVQLPPLLGESPERPALVGGGGGEDLVQHRQHLRGGVHAAASSS